MRKSAPRAAGITFSGDDTVLAADADALDLEVVVEHDQVGWKPDIEPAKVGLAADLIILDDNLEIERVCVGGEDRVVA